jgi:predicted GH43/DUF377 family glycosyl hydrolase
MIFSKVKNLFKISLTLFFISISIAMFGFVRKIERKMKYAPKLSYLFTDPCVNGTFFLENVPNGEDTKLVVNKRNVNIRGLNTIYNASIINYKDHYLMAFRYDDYNKEAHFGYYSKIGIVELDRNFRQMEKEYVLLNCHEAEDPRLISHDKKVFIVFNSGQKPDYCNRVMHIAEIDYETLETKEIKSMDLKLNNVEKNWSPFLYSENQDSPNIYFEYNIPKREILKNTPNGIKFAHQGKEFVKNLKWNWGAIRGGTQAIKIDDHYLAFFHSSFDDKITDKKFYVMGAYTFEDKPPFNVTRISHHPILFQGIYTSAPKALSSPLLRCIYPAGIATEIKDDKTYFHISCGENDSSVKIITIDKKTLYKTFREIK